MPGLKNGNGSVAVQGQVLADGVYACLFGGPGSLSSIAWAMTSAGEQADASATSGVGRRSSCSDAQHVHAMLLARPRACTCADSQRPVGRRADRDQSGQGAQRSCGPGEHSAPAGRDGTGRDGWSCRVGSVARVGKRSSATTTLACKWSVCRRTARVGWLRVGPDTMARQVNVSYDC